ncbi:MAG: NAD(P)-dependent oxidoreductase [Patescibacteria group bacterium]
MNILITEPKDYSKKALDIYKKLGRVCFCLPRGASAKWGVKLSGQEKLADILVIGLKYQIDKKFLDQTPNLKIIASPVTGMNHIDLNYLKSKGIKLISLRGKKSFLRNVPSTAEETFALILALFRKLPWAFDSVKNSSWDRIEWRGNQLMNKTIGLLGFGRLGKIVARYAKAFNMKVISCDPNVSEKFMKSRGVEKVSMEDLFKKSDIVSLHVLLTDDTQNLIREKHLKSMKPSAYLINTARAELIEKDALYNALKNKWIAGAAVDVMWDEYSDGSHLKKDPLWNYAKKNNNLIILPHIGGATFEAMEVTQDFIAELVFKDFKNKKIA